MSALRTGWGKQKPPVGTPLAGGLEINVNLVAAYLMAEQAGAVLYDSTGIYPCTATTPLWVTTVNGFAINANASSSNYFSNSGGITAGAVPVSMAVWGRATTATGGPKVIAAVGEPNTGSGWGLRQTSSNDVQFEYHTVAAVDTTALDTNPHMWAGTNDGTTGGLKYYRDGVLIATGTKSLATQTSLPIGIGGSASDGLYWSGYIEQAMFWVGSALKDSDILSLYLNRYQSWSAPSVKRAWLSAGSTTVNGAATLLGNSTLTATSQAAGSASLLGNSLLASTGITRVFGVANLTGFGLLTATGINQLFGSCNLNGYATLTASGLAGLFGVATLTGNSTVTVAGQTLILASATLAGNSLLTATGINQIFASATINAFATLTATGGLAGGTVSGAAFLGGYSSLIATGRVFTPIHARLLSTSTSTNLSATTTKTGIGTTSAKTESTGTNTA